MYTFIHKVVFIVTKTLFLYDLQREFIGILAAISSYILNKRLSCTDDVMYNDISDYRMEFLKGCLLKIAILTDVK